MLKAEQVSVRYGERTVVDGLSFSLGEGQWLMLAGPNGAGKSTLIRAITQGVPYEGRIELLGRDVRAYRPAQLARQVGVFAHGAATDCNPRFQGFHSVVNGLDAARNIVSAPRSHRLPFRRVARICGSVIKLHFFLGVAYIIETYSVDIIISYYLLAYRSEIVGRFGHSRIEHI